MRFPALFRHEEDALDVPRAASCHARPRHPRDQREPRHPDDAASCQASDEGQMRVIVVGPPGGKVSREGVHGLLRLLGGGRVQPQQISQVRQVLRSCEANLHAVSVS